MTTKRTITANKSSRISFVAKPTEHENNTETSEEEEVMDYSPCTSTVAELRGKRRNSFLSSSESNLPNKVPNSHGSKNLPSRTLTELSPSSPLTKEQQTPAPPEWQLKMDQILLQQQELLSKFQKNDAQQTIQPQIGRPIQDIDRLLKRMSKFSGTALENFNAWMLNTNTHLSEYSHLSEEQKRKIVILKLDGYPREIVERMGVSCTIKDIFLALGQTYGQDKASLLASIRQLPEETVKVYWSRLKTTLNILGYQEDIDPYSNNEVYKDFFLKGLNANLRSRVQYLLPVNLNAAVSQALQAEQEIASKELNKAKKTTDFLNTTQTVFGQSEATSAQIDGNFTNMQQCLQQMQNQLSKQIAESLPAVRTASAQPSSPQPDQGFFRNNGFRTYNYPPQQDRPNIVCFNCKRLGHSFRRCPTITEPQKNHIAANKPALIDATRKAEAEKRTILNSTLSSRSRQPALNSQTASGQPSSSL